MKGQLKRTLRTNLALPTLLSILLIGCGGGAPEVGEESAGSDTTVPGEVAIDTDPISAEDVEITPDIVVENQTADDTFIVVESVSMPADGWVVIYSDADGEPGDVLAQEPVFLGINPRVSIDLGQTPDVGTKLVAVLHEDTGAAGEFEFPGGDDPIDQGGKVMASFAIEAAE